MVGGRETGERDPVASPGTENSQAEDPVTLGLFEGSIQGLSGAQQGGRSGGWASRWALLSVSKITYK